MLVSVNCLRRPAGWPGSVGMAGRARLMSSTLGNSENLFGRRTNGFKPPTDIHLRVRFAAKMPGGGTVGGCQVPPENSKILISALDHEPVARIVTDNPTNFALEFFHTRHAFSVERWLGKDASIASTRAWRSSAVPTSRREGGN